VSEFLEGNAVTLLENGGDFFPALQQAIDGASKEVFLEPTSSKTTRPGAASPRRCGEPRARVAVRLLVDGFGGRLFVRDLMPE